MQHPIKLSLLSTLSLIAETVNGCVDVIRDISVLERCEKFQLFWKWNFIIIVPWKEFLICRRSDLIEILQFRCLLLVVLLFFLIDVCQILFFCGLCRRMKWDEVVCETRVFRAILWRSAHRTSWRRDYASVLCTPWRGIFWFEYWPRRQLFLHMMFHGYPQSL